ncbi:MAG: type II toxin-antitoxin system RelE/ParE family toxin, partial [Devosia sp.]|nr:type II toxin-antitoxin system RelE/ParE family toxin [Devosia sp.]
MIVAFTEEAEADLQAIGDYIAYDNPDRAASFVEEIIDRCLKIGQNPSAFALVPRYAHLGIRKRSFGSYLIFYRASEETVEVLHI